MWSSVKRVATLSRYVFTHSIVLLSLEPNRQIASLAHLAVSYNSGASYASRRGRRCSLREPLYRYGSMQYKPSRFIPNLDLDFDSAFIRPLKVSSSKTLLINATQHEGTPAAYSGCCFVFVTSCVYKVII